MHSIFSEAKECWICGSCRWLELHQVFGGANKKKSEKYGLMVYLCHYCHNEPPNGVHHNKERMDWLRAEGQKRFEAEHPELDFLKVFGKNYL
jgi:NAD-dependent dihydropyrimidine dehydrogenase PreA subunit